MYTRVRGVRAGIVGGKAAIKPLRYIVRKAYRVSAWSCRE